MKCNHCKEKIPRNEAKCPKCGAEIDEGHWAIGFCEVMVLIGLLLSLLMLFYGVCFAKLGDSSVVFNSDFRGNDKLVRFYLDAEIPCMFIQTAGAAVLVAVLLAIISPIRSRKWNFILDIVVALPTLMYGYNLAYLAICSVYGECPLADQITYLLIFLYCFVLMCTAWIAGGRIKAKKIMWRKKRRQAMGKDDKELINCGKCGADLPKDADVCPVCGRKITVEDIAVPDNLAIWCSALAFKFRGAWSGWRSRVFVYVPTDYTLPERTTQSMMFFGAAIPMVWSLVFSVICLCMAIDLGVPGDLWIYTLGKVNVPVYIFAVAACIAVFVFTFFLNRHIIKAINYKEWERGVTVRLLASLGIRVGLAAVLVPCMLFLDVRVLLTIPLLAVLCISQILLLILSRAVKKRIELYNEYAKDMIEKRDTESVTKAKYKNKKYMYME